MRKETQLASAEEGGAAQDQIMPNIVQETVDPEVKVNTRNKRNSPTQITQAAPARKKRSELEKLLRARGLGVDGSGVFTTRHPAGDGDISGGDVVGESPQTPVESGSVESPVLYTTKKSKSTTHLPMRVNKTGSLRACTGVPSSSDSFYIGSKSSKAVAKTTTSRNAGSGEGGGMQGTDYETLSHVSGTTEVIFDRYPALCRLASAKRGKKRRSNGVGKDFRKIPGIDVFVFLCRKASISGCNVAVKAGAENCVAGRSKQLIFLRRNAAKVRARVRVSV